MVLATSSSRHITLSSKKFFGVASVALMAASMSSSTTTTQTMAMTVPEYLLPSGVMQSMNWNKASLVPIDFAVGITEGAASAASDVISKNTASKGSQGQEV
ncbi:MAG: hypothetical protein SGARI_008334 [Bacillariaceae sp.]